jgi:hypothetical protein
MSTEYINVYIIKRIMQIAESIVELRTLICHITTYTSEAIRATYIDFHYANSIHGKSQTLVSVSASVQIYVHFCN